MIFNDSIIPASQIFPCIIFLNVFHYGATKSHSFCLAETLVLIKHFWYPFRVLKSIIAFNYPCFFIASFIAH